MNFLTRNFFSRILISLNVFAGVIFFLYRGDVIGFDVSDLWKCFKLVMSYGIRGEYGVSHEMTNTIETRMVFDLAFYFIVSTESEMFWPVAGRVSISYKPAALFYLQRRFWQFCGIFFSPLLSTLLESYVSCSLKCECNRHSNYPITIFYTA